MTRGIRVLLFTGLVAAFEAVGAGALALSAQDAGGPRGPAVGRGGAMLPLRQLDLTEAQQTQIHQLVERHRSETRPLVERLRTAVDARRQAMEASPVDEGRIRAAVEEHSRVEADLAVHQARLRGEILALLTPEQQQRAAQLRAERDARPRRR